MKPKRRMHLHAHARARAEQRFGVHINKWDMKELVTAIQNASKRKDEVRTIGRQTHTRSRFDVLYQGKWIPVVYDTKRHGIVTVLPEHELGNLCI